MFRYTFSIFRFALFCHVGTLAHSPQWLKSRHPTFGQQVHIPALEAIGMTAQLLKPDPIINATDGHKVGYSVPLHPRKGISTTSRFMNTIIDDLKTNHTLSRMPSTNSSQINNVSDTVWITPVTVGGQELQLVFDTGSSDTWIVADTFQCKDDQGQAVSSSVCRFSTAYQRTSTFTQNTSSEFRLGYADGEKLQGIVGTETLSISGITVKNQTVGLVQEANWWGDGISSGLLGMAFPSLTTAVIDKGSDSSAIHYYDSVFHSMYKQGLVNPVFAVALSGSGEQSGVLSLGGLPDDSISYNNDFARVPMEKLNLKKKMNGKLEYTMYVFEADGFSVDRKQIDLKTRFIVDTGTTRSLVPQSVLQAIAESWVPPLKTPEPNTGEYKGPCSGTAPDIAITIGGKQIWINGSDLMYPAETDGQEQCELRVQSNDGSITEDLYIFGATFLKNTVAVFDVGMAEMKFANRIRS